MDKELGKKYPFDDKNEKIYRAVLPKALYWDSNGRVTSAAFKLRPKERGVSIERGMGRSDIQCKEHMMTYLNGDLVYLTVGDCLSIVSVRLEHSPSLDNPYHSEIIYNKDITPKVQWITHQLAIHAKKL